MRFTKLGVVATLGIAVGITCVFQLIQFSSLGHPLDRYHIVLHHHIDILVNSSIFRGFDDSEEQRALNGSGRRKPNSSLVRPGHFLSANSPQRPKTIELGTHVKTSASVSSTESHTVSFHRKDSGTLLLCKKTRLCDRGKAIVKHVRKRNKPDIIKSRLRTLNTTNVTFYIHDKLKKFFRNTHLLSQAALSNCHTRCYLSSAKDKANVHVVLFDVPRNQQKGVISAVINLEAHHYLNLPLNRHDWILISYHRSSDLVITYGNSVFAGLTLCPKHDNNTRICEPHKKHLDQFSKWCDSSYDGHFFTCLFNVMPHILQTNNFSLPNKSLASVWISATCGRHNNYLQELMKYIKIDRFGGCFRNSDENTHIGLKMRDVDGLFGGQGTIGSMPRKKRGSRKVVLSSRYMFYISMENTIMDDYVTEKFFQGFVAESLMVYLGAPNAKDYAPADHSFVDALDFEGPKALAERLLYLQGDVKAYESYFAWRRNGQIRTKPGFNVAVEHSFIRMDHQSTLCRACEYLSNSHKSA